MRTTEAGLAARWREWSATYALVMLAVSGCGSPLEPLSAPKDQSTYNGDNAVAIDGDVVVMGQPEPFSGQEKAFAWILEGEEWGEPLELLPPREVECDFGRAVGVSGDTILVGGARVNQVPNAGPSLQGCVAAYRRHGDAFALEQDIVGGIVGGQGTSLGKAVAIQGDTVAVGSTDLGDLAGAGNVSLFRRAVDTWTNEQNLSLPAEEGFGFDVEVSGNIAVVLSSVGGHVFARAAGAWTEEASLALDAGESPLDVSVDGNVIALGTGSGVVHVYERDGGKWVRVQTLQPDSSEEHFGRAVAVRGDVLVVGAPGGGTADEGEVHVFQREEAEWSEATALSYDDTTGFGAHVATDGETIAIAIGSSGRERQLVLVAPVEDAVGGCALVRRTGSERGAPALLLGLMVSVVGFRARRALRPGRPWSRPRPANDAAVEHGNAPAGSGGARGLMAAFAPVRILLTRAARAEVGVIHSIRAARSKLASLALCAVGIGGCGSDEATAPSPPQAGWTRGFAGSSSASLALDAGGNAFVTGQYYGSVDFGGGHVIAASATGTEQSGGEVFLASFASDGGTLWSKGFPTSAPSTPQSDSGASVVVNPEGVIFLTGWFAGTIDFGLGPLTTPTSLAPNEDPAEPSLDGFVAGLGPDPSSPARWATQLGEGYDDRATSVGIDGLGNVYAAGQFGGMPNPPDRTDLVSFDPAGAPRWSKTYSGGARSLAVTGDGTCYLAGVSQGALDFGSGLVGPNYGAVLASIGSDGSTRWFKGFGLGPDTVLAGPGNALVAVDAGGNSYLAGDFAGTQNFGSGPLSSVESSNDVFLASFDRDGMARWSKSYGGPAHDDARAIAIDSSGNLYLAGSTDGTIDFGTGSLSGLYVASFASDGAVRWSRGFGHGWCSSMALDATGNIYLTGGIVTAVDFGSGPVSRTDATSMFVAKVAPP